MLDNLKRKLLRSSSKEVPEIVPDAEFEKQPVEAVPDAEFEKQPVEAVPDTGAGELNVEEAPRAESMNKEAEESLNPNADEMKDTAASGRAQILAGEFLESKHRWAESFSTAKLFAAIKRYARKVGVTTIYYVLLLYYALLSDKITGWQKTLALAALGYFISPFDFVPDIVPGGLVDDASILMFALGVIGEAIDAETESRAKEQLRGWFNDDEVFEISRSDLKSALELKGKLKVGKNLRKLIR